MPEFSGKPVIGGVDCVAVTKTPSDGETFNIGSITVKALHTPCHTQDSICWFMQDGDDKAVFTGDTLFTGGWLFTHITTISRLTNVPCRMW
jgi:hydroxyacylglutathione hydrolase